ncbi:MAG: hypothetical protein ACQEWM_05385 [Actinomycetota bacterium]
MADDPAADPQPEQGHAAVAPAAAESDAVLGRRAQILATEHWSLLAARGTAQSEVLTRITIFLTLVSAGLVTMGLLGQASGFRGWFSPAMLGILAFLAVIGLMTQLRVINVGGEDLMYVVAMNRLRGGYVDLDPKVAQYFLASVTDDLAGMDRTYSFIVRRSSLNHLLASSMVLIVVVNACVDGLLVGAVVVTATGAVGWAVAAGVVAGAAWLVGAMWLGYLGYREAWRRYRPRRPTEGPPAFLRD